jgi:hypothetical protein
MVRDRHHIHPYIGTSSLLLRFSMTPISKLLTSHVRRFQATCRCVGPCTGYDSRSSCPPLLSWPLSQTARLQFRSAMHRRAAMNTRLVATMVVVMGLLLCAIPLSGQPTLRNLKGTVQDRHHEPLNGAVVEIENENTKGVISYITDRSGRYSFKRIQGEVDYRVWFTYRGQRSKVRELSQFDDRPNATINLMVKSY